VAKRKTEKQTNKQKTNQQINKQTKNNNNKTHTHTKKTEKTVFLLTVMRVTFTPSIFMASVHPPVPHACKASM